MSDESDYVVMRRDGRGVVVPVAVRSTVKEAANKLASEAWSDSEKCEAYSEQRNTFWIEKVRR